MLVHRHSHSDDEQWAPVSDLMAVIMLVFMLIVMILLSYSNWEDKSNDEKCKDTKELLENKFSGKFEDWKERWKAELDDDLTIRFAGQVILFDVGDEIPSTVFARSIKEFFPAYMDVIREIKRKYGDDEVLAIRIEGHTSSEHKGSTGPNDAFLKNMELSQNRARGIIKTVLAYPEAVNYNDIVLSEVRADGLSSSKLKCSEKGEENPDASRRVEFKLLTNSCQQAGIYDKTEVLTNYCSK